MAKRTAVLQPFPAIDNEVVDGLRRQIAREVQRICPDHLASHRDDIVQSALIRVVRLIDVEEGTSFSLPYLRKAAISATVDEIRRQRRRSEAILDDGSADRLVHACPGPEERVINQQVGHAIRIGLARLGGDRRQAVVMHLRGHSVPEAAVTLGWSRKRVANLTFRGLRDLRRGLVAQGIHTGVMRQTPPAGWRMDVERRDETGA